MATRIVIIGGGPAGYEAALVAAGRGPDVAQVTVVDSDGIGGLNDTKTDSLRAYVNGKPFAGDPATIELTAHRQVALIYGPRDATDEPAASYSFGPGE